MELEIVVFDIQSNGAKCMQFRYTTEIMTCRLVVDATMKK